MSMLSRKGPSVRRPGSAPRRAGARRALSQRVVGSRGGVPGSTISACAKKRASCPVGSPSLGSLNTRPSLYDALLQLKAKEDEKSLCQREWSGDVSLDQDYGSVFLQIREASSESEGPCDFIKKACGIVGRTLAVTVLLGMFMVLPFGMISIGVKYLTECPKEPKIPIYLLVGGCFGLLKLLSMLWKQVRSRRYERLDEIYDTDEDHGDVMMSKSSRFTDVVLSLFLFVWFACGNYWVFSIWPPNFDQMLHDPSSWCDKTVYMFAFVQICISYGLMGLIVFLSLILAICQKLNEDKS